jgi:hypothetical protein
MTYLLLWKPQSHTTCCLTEMEVGLRDMYVGHSGISIACAPENSASDIVFFRDAERGAETKSKKQKEGQ